MVRREDGSKITSTWLRSESRSRLRTRHPQACRCDHLRHRVRTGICDHDPAAHGFTASELLIHLRKRRPRSCREQQFTLAPGTNNLDARFRLAPSLLTTSPSPISGEGQLAGLTARMIEGTSTVDPRLSRAVAQATSRSTRTACFWDRFRNLSVEGDVHLVAQGFQASCDVVADVAYFL
jgi:hypothetical protein